MPQGWAHGVCDLACTAPWKVLRQGRAVAAGLLRHSTNTPGMTQGHIVQGQGDNKTTLPLPFPCRYTTAGILECCVVLTSSSGCVCRRRRGAGQDNERITYSSLPEPCSSSVLLSELGEVGGRGEGII